MYADTCKSKKEGKDQESIQSSTAPDTVYQWESNKLTIRHHKREPRGQPFCANFSDSNILPLTFYNLNNIAYHGVAYKIHEMKCLFLVECPLIIFLTA